MDAFARSADGAALRVLVVEDDVSLGRLIERALGPSTRAITVVRSGKAALEALEGSSFDAIAADISLPDMSGHEVIARARALSPSCGIVAITGFVDVEVAVRSMKAGADDFLGKPFDADILWHVLQKSVANRSRQMEAEQATAYRRLAYTDALTGCPNRRFIDEFIVEAVEGSKRSGTPLTAAFLDLDNFKLLNDFVGHEEGDHVLTRVAEALGAHIRPPAAFARFGGDEFVVIFPGMDELDAKLMLGKARDAIGHIEVVDGTKTRLPTRISCGVAAYRGHETPRALIANAEDQMYLDRSVSPVLVATAYERATPSALSEVTNLRALRSLVKAIDRRDSYTRYHSDHATQLALRVAHDLGVMGDALNAITIGGPIHDLGKIVVPDEILRKPGPLTREERHHMEEHPVIGAAITAAVTDYDVVVELVRHHHERFDGEGYPGKLKGMEVSLSTRIFTLADSFSAMTTDRPYRKGLTTEQAIDQIERGRGTQFDPDLAVEFIQLAEREFGQRAPAA
ncbi:MAG: diguanylate cyclase [Anaerolineaceae bacterium]